MKASRQSTSELKWRLDMLRWKWTLRGRLFSSHHRHAGDIKRFRAGEGPGSAVKTLVVDAAFITQLQLRLAYDVAVLYRIPLDLSDPDDLWKLIRLAFTIKSGEAVREGVAKAVPALIRPVIKRFCSGGVLSAARGLPFVGKYLLQRNIIKIGIPLVGVPLAVVLNRYTTLLAGRHAQAVFRNEARVIELAENLKRTQSAPPTNALGGVARHHGGPQDLRR